MTPDTDRDPATGTASSAAGGLSDESRQMLADISEDPDRPLAVIENLLPLTRAEAGRRRESGSRSP